MKTTSVKIEAKSGWQKLETLLGTTFTESETYALQIRGDNADVALSDTKPAEADYFFIRDGENFNWKYDGTNTLWIKSDLPISNIRVIVSQEDIWLSNGLKRRF